MVALQVEELDHLLRAASIKGNGIITVQELAAAFELLRPEVVLLRKRAKEHSAAGPGEGTRHSDSTATGSSETGREERSPEAVHADFERRMAEALAVVSDIKASSSRVR